MRFDGQRVLAQAPTSNASQMPDGMPPHVARNIEKTAGLDGKDRLNMGPSDHFADLMTKFSGSMLFVWLHMVWFGAWIALNVAGVLTFDDFPFGFLTMIVSLEAIFLSTFVLISQNRQALQSDRRAKVDLQVNLISEQEITKIMSLVAEIHDNLSLGGRHDPELEHMQQETRVESLADAVDNIEAGTNAARAREAAPIRNTRTYLRDAGPWLCWQDPERGSERCVALLRPPWRPDRTRSELSAIVQQICSLADRRTVR
jgi:uncharacterized membrane protein